MKLYFAVLTISLVACFDCAQAAEPAGVYVDRESPSRRIELLANNRYSVQYCGIGDGTYSKTDHTLICVDKHSRKMEFRLVDGNLIDSDGQTWVPREELAKLPWNDVSPVTFVVVDAKSHKPLTEFAYGYTITTPQEEYDPLLVRPIEVKSVDGAVQLSAPPSCKIGLDILGGAVLRGDGRRKQFTLSATDKTRRFEIAVATGVLVQGTVVDASTGKSIAGAEVAPIIFTTRRSTTDSGRTVVTDADGRFSVNGVDPGFGIEASHPDYFDLWVGFSKAEKSAENIYSTRIELKPGETLTGNVKDPAGNPVADVRIGDGVSRSAQTNKDGTFVLRCPSKSRGKDTYTLSFEKDGYLDKTLSPKSAEPGGFSVVLEPLPQLRGRVVGPDGRPVQSFTVSAGVGLEPRKLWCSTENISDAEGRFSLPIHTDEGDEESGKVWIGIQAPGFALWETTVAIGQIGDSITANVIPGATVKGSVKSSKTFAGLSVKLLPIRIHEEDFTSDTSQRQELGRRETAVDAAGVFQFEHIAMGQYILAVSGPEISPFSTAITVATSDVDAGTLAISGRGSISGLAYQATMICEGDICRLDPNRNVWAFAKGNISFAVNSGRSNRDEFEHLQPIPFRTDEHGRFHVEGIPIGMVSINFPYHLTADIIDAHSRTARVNEGQDTEVRFFDKSGTWDLTCQFVVGDGSPEQFSTGTGMGAARKVGNHTDRPPAFKIELLPQDDASLSFEAADWIRLDDQKQILLRDVQPGKYKVVVGDWLTSTGCDGKLHEMNVDTRSGPTTLTIPLGAGSITGKIGWTKRYRRMIGVTAVGQKSRAVFSGRCDDEENFCVRYLPVDKYTLFAHDDEAGWCQLPDVTVNNNISDIGSHQLVAGGTIFGKVPERFASNPAVTVVATDSHGVPVEFDPVNESIGTEFKLPSLWPGKWTVSLMEHGKPLSTQTVELHGTESVLCDLR